MSLTQQHCVPCEGGTKPLTREEFSAYVPQIPNWEIIGQDTTLRREFVCANFKDAIAFVQKIALVAESEGHHPDLFLHDYKKVTITLSTHAIGGLSINDFVLAAKIDAIEISDKK